MKYFMRNLVAILGLSVVATGAIFAAAYDCGDEDVQPIKIHSTSSSMSKRADMHG